MDFNSRPNPLELRFIMMGVATMEFRGLPIGLVAVLVVPLFGQLSISPPDQWNLWFISNALDHATSTCYTSSFPSRPIMVWDFIFRSTWIYLLIFHHQILIIFGHTQYGCQLHVLIKGTCERNMTQLIPKYMYQTVQNAREIETAWMVRIYRWRPSSALIIYYLIQRSSVLDA